tara:strand:+ start:55 stop:549 length:495 start_codon:yes stop_codon:yes gene_type:complete
MGKLKNLFDKLNSLEYCRFTENGIYPTEEGNHIVELRPKELLEIGRTYPCREHVMIAYFGETPTKVLYFGENASSMFQTLQNLKNPNHSSNIGETVFKHFKYYLEEHQNQNTPISLEQKVPCGREHQFDLVLKKLNHVYGGHSIDEKFYAALRNGAEAGLLSRT